MSVLKEVLVRLPLVRRGHCTALTGAAALPPASSLALSSSPLSFLPLSTPPYVRLTFLSLSFSLSLSLSLSRSPLALAL